MNQHFEGLKSPRLILPLLPPCVLAMCLFAAIMAHAEVFEVEGTIKYESLAPIYSAPPMNFKVSVSDCQWQIHLERSQPTNQAIKYTEISSDGVDVYYVDYPTDPTNTLFAKIISGAVPLADGKMPSTLWLAFCSKCYLDKSLNKKIRPVWSVDEHLFETGAYMVQADWNNSTEPPFLPTNVVFYNDGMDYPFNGYPKEAVPAPAPYNQGYMAAVYKVSDAMNIGKLWIPRDFSLLLYGPKADGKSTNDLVSVAKWSGHVTKATTNISIEAMVPKIARKTYVADARFVNILTNFKTMNYLVTNGWLQTNDPILIEGVANAKNVKPGELPMGKKQKYFLTIFLLFAFLGPLVVIFINMNSKQRSL